MDLMSRLKLVLVFTILNSLSAIAQSADTSSGVANIDPQWRLKPSAVSNSSPGWSWEGQLPIDAIQYPGGTRSSVVRMQDFEIKLTRELSENIRASVKLKLDRTLRENGSFLPQSFNFEDFIKEAKIEIRNIGGRPIALVIGKQEMAFGVDTTRMPMPPESPIHGLVVENEVVGFSVALDQGFSIFDKVEISGFETKSGDLKIGSFDGASVRLSKNITDQLKVALSSMYLGNGYDPNLRAETRESVGLVFKDRNGSYQIYTEAVHFNNNPLYKDSHYSFAAGVAAKAGPGEVVVEATLIPHSLRQFGVGYNFELRKNLYVGPEIRYTKFNQQYSLVNGTKSGVQIGMRVKYLFSGSSASLQKSN